MKSLGRLSWGRAVAPFRLADESIDPRALKEFGVHFDILRERHKAAAIVDLRMDDDGEVTYRIEP